MSNHEEAMRYIRKCKLLGIEKFELELLPDDVLLVDVSDKESTDKIVIPSFITKVTDEGRNIVGPFKECKFEEVYIDNKKGTLKTYHFYFSNQSLEG